MIILFKATYSRPARVEGQTRRVTEEFFRNWPERRPASELEVLLLSEALGCGESVLRKEMALAVAGKSPRKPLPATPQPATGRGRATGWQCVQGGRGQRGILYWPQLEQLLRRCDALRRSSARALERAREINGKLDALVSHSVELKSVSEMQRWRAGALLETARLAAVYR